MQDVLNEVRCREQKVGREKGGKIKKYKPQKERGKTFGFTNHIP